MRLRLLGLAAVGIMGIPLGGEGQGPDPHWLTIRGTFGSQIAGFRRVDPTGGDPFTWRHRVRSAWGVGASVSAPLGAGEFGVRADADILRELKLRGDEAGPVLTTSDASEAYWLTVSAWAAPAVLCGYLCLSVSTGYGIGHYDFPQVEGRGHVVNPVTEPQTIGVWRIGVEVRVARVKPGVVIQIADYIGDVRPFYEGEDLSTLHLLLVSVGLGIL